MEAETLFGDLGGLCDAPGLLDFAACSEDDLLALLAGDDLLAGDWGLDKAGIEVVPPLGHTVAPAPVLPPLALSKPVPPTHTPPAGSPQYSGTSSAVLLRATVSKGPSRQRSTASAGASKPSVSLPSLNNGPTQAGQWRTVTTMAQPEQQAATSKPAEDMPAPPRPTKAARTSARTAGPRARGAARVLCPEPPTEDFESDDDSNDLDVTSEPEEDTIRRNGSAAPSATTGTGLRTRPSVQTTTNNVAAGSKRKAPEVDWRSITDPAERRRQRRLAKNRLTAARSRERKKCQWAEMEEKLAGIEAQNAELRQALEALGTENTRLREQLASALGGASAGGAAGGVGVEKRVHSEPAALVILLAIMLTLCTLHSSDTPVPSPTFTLPGVAVPALLLIALLLMKRSSASSRPAHAVKPETAIAAENDAQTAQQQRALLISRMSDDSVRGIPDRPSSPTLSCDSTDTACPAVFAPNFMSPVPSADYGEACAPGFVDAALRVVACALRAVSPHSAVREATPAGVLALPRRRVKASWLSDVVPMVVG